MRAGGAPGTRAGTASEAAATTRSPESSEDARRPSRSTWPTGRVPPAEGPDKERVQRKRANRASEAATPTGHPSGSRALTGAFQPGPSSTKVTVISREMGGVE